MKKQNRPQQGQTMEIEGDQGGQSLSPPVKARHSLLEDVSLMLLKILLIAAFLGVLFLFLFGIYRNGDISMDPAVKDGDVVVYFRLNKDYVASDLVVYEYTDSLLTGRVVAVAGDTVDITANGLMINGALQQEKDIFYDTLPYTEGPEFPITVGEGQIFLLGDNREKATDSRAFGCINISDTRGEVMAILRRRNF